MSWYCSKSLKNVNLPEVMSSHDWRDRNRKNKKVSKCRVTFTARSTVNNINEPSQPKFLQKVHLKPCLFFAYFKKDYCFLNFWIFIKLTCVKIAFVSWKCAKPGYLGYN